MPFLSLRCFRVLVAVAVGSLVACGVVGANDEAAEGNAETREAAADERQVDRGGAEGTPKFASLLASYEDAYSKCDSSASVAAHWIDALSTAIDAILADPNNPQISEPAEGKRIPAPRKMLILSQLYVGRYTDMTSAEFHEAIATQLDRLIDAGMPEDIEKNALFSRHFLVQQQWASQRGAGPLTLDDCRELADDYFEKYPEDTQYGPTLHWWATSSSSNLADVEAACRVLQARYPDHRTTKIALGRLRTLTIVARPFEMKFADLLTGDEVNVPEDYRGRVVLIDFWATWCGPCVGKMPHIKSDLEEFADEGFAAIGVTVDEPSDDSPEATATKRREVVAFLEQNDYTWPQFFHGSGASAKFMSDYGVNAYPTVFLLDREGRLRWLNRTFFDNEGNIVSPAMPEKEAIKALLRE